MNCSCFQSLFLYSMYSQSWPSLCPPVNSLQSVSVLFAVTRNRHNIKCSTASAKELYWTWQLHEYQSRPECSWPSLLQGHTAGSCLTCCSQEHQDLSLQNCFSDSQLWPVLFHWVIPSRSKTEFSPVGLHKVPVYPLSRFLWRVAFPSSELSIKKVWCHSQVWWQKVPSEPGRG